MNKHIFSILEPGNPLMTQALDAMKRYYEAQAAKASEVELERLRLEAESLFQAVSEFQQRVMGRRDDTFH
ncbi:hypothetical protein [Pseudomonas sp. B8(2017)]|uniref:hypothetical protein n=1 Tax=Pseudomonas sp. B8(2017) TaxID=1981711 RepID=UPI001481F636|nr:hypothetical protein [Pseudomonas sp. B8(2017)]